MKKFIFGLGTGRCGTHALKTLLNMQKDFNISHEAFRLPWKPDLVGLGMALSILNMQYLGNIVGDVALWYLPYVEQILPRIPDALFICFQRDREETVESFMKKVPESNHWTADGSSHWSTNDKINDSWRPLFPKYDAPKKEAINMYWMDYYRNAGILESRYSNFKTFDMNKSLNTEDGQKALLSFVGIDEADMTLQIGLKTNTGRHGS